MDLLGYSSEEGKAPDRPATVPGPTRERKASSDKGIDAAGIMRA